MALSARGPQIKVQDQSINHVLSQSLAQIIHIRARAHRWPMLALFIRNNIHPCSDKAQLALEAYISVVFESILLILYQIKALQITKRMRSSSKESVKSFRSSDVSKRTTAKWDGENSTSHNPHYRVQLFIFICVHASL